MVPIRMGLLVGGNLRYLDYRSHLQLLKEG